MSALPTGTIQTLQNALGVLLKTANGPSPLDSFEQCRWEMSGAHATILRGLLSAYEVCNLVSLWLARVLSIHLSLVLASNNRSIVKAQGFCSLLSPMECSTSS